MALCKIMYFLHKSNTFILQPYSSSSLINFLLLPPPSPRRALSVQLPPPRIHCWLPISERCMVPYQSVEMFWKKYLLPHWVHQLLAHLIGRGVMLCYQFYVHYSSTITQTVVLSLHHHSQMMHVICDVFWKREHTGFWLSNFHILKSNYL